MNKIIKVLFFGIDNDLINHIIDSIVESGFIPEHYKCESKDELCSIDLLDEIDVFILDDEHIGLNLHCLQKLRGKANNSIIIILIREFDEFYSAQYIKSGCDIVIPFDNIYKIGEFLKKISIIKCNQSDMHSLGNELENTDRNCIFDKYPTSNCENLQLKQEILELLKNEGRLKQSQTFLNTILENIPNLIYVKDIENLKFIYVNQVSEKLIGYRPDELIGNSVDMIFTKDYADLYNAKDKELLNKIDKIDFSEEIITTKENRIKVFYTKKLLIHNEQGQLKYLLGISEDMTDHYKAQEELRKSELRFSKIFHASPVAIFVLSSNDNTFVDVNARFLEIVGYERKDIIGQKIDFFCDIFSNDALNTIKNGIDSKNEFINYEVILNTKSNDKITLLLSHEQMVFADECWGIFMGLDITSRKIAELEVSAALERQKELNLLKIQFISMISHEFRTPLTTIMLSTDLLSRYMDNWDIVERNKHFNRIKDTILKMTQLMENVLIIGRIDSGKFFFNPEPIDLSSFCFTLAKNVEFSNNSSHQINLEFNGNCGNVLVDENLLGLVINNLLSNAIKYSPSSKKVDFIVNCNSTRIEFIFSDKGIGIPDENLSRLFQAFYRATNVGPIAGYGLGLSIVKKCVEAHNGKIDVRSKINEGTTFIVTIPNV